MDHHNILGEIVSSDAFLADHEICSTRRGLLVAPLLAALSLALSDEAALAGTINPSETQITLPGAIKWDGWIAGSPPRSGEMATLYGGLDKPGPYLVLMKWYPGYMSAPHTYATDRLSLVLSGTWWVNSGADFDPENTVPVPAGGFVRRIARTPHYDEVKKDANEPAVIGLSEGQSRATAALSRELGKVVLDGTADELRDHKDVKEFYLGGTGDQRKNLKSFKRRKRWL